MHCSDKKSVLNLLVSIHCFIQEVVHRLIDVSLDVLDFTLLIIMYHHVNGGNFGNHLLNVLLVDALHQALNLTLGETEVLHDHILKLFILTVKDCLIFIVHQLWRLVNTELNLVGFTGLLVARVFLLISEVTVAITARASSSNSF